MRSKYIMVAVFVVLATAGAVVAVSAGDPDNPPGPPEGTYSFTLEDIYNRLDSGAAGTQIAFTEPMYGPTAGTGRTLDEIMAIAPAVDDTNGASATQVLTGMTFWGLTTGGWGLSSGTMADNGQVVIMPGTASQTIAAGYHNGSGYVLGDADLVARNIVKGVTIFGVNGTASTGTSLAPVPKTGQTISYASRDDGDLEYGVAWPSPRFVTGTTGIVTDTLTGLIWLRDANCFGVQKTWTQALSDANSLASGSCGLSDGSSAGDWRLPNVRERQSLIDYGFSDPALPSGHPFTNVQWSGYWSSTTVAGNTTYAWCVSMHNGRVQEVEKSNTRYVMPVRGGQ